MQLANLLDEICGCNLCPFGAAKNPIAPEPPEHPITIMIIAEAPSPEENIMQQPWFDRHNKYLAKLAHTIFSPSETYYTYLVKCNPVPEKIGVKNSKICIDNYISKEIKLLRPKIILTLGQTCAKMLLGNYSKKPEVGDIFIDGYDEKHNFMITNWSSASFIFNANKQKEVDFLKFLEKLKGLVQIV
jgi:uracil-DNA glycosylase family 4